MSLFVLFLVRVAVAVLVERLQRVDGHRTGDIVSSRPHAIGASGPGCRLPRSIGECIVCCVTTAGKGLWWLRLTSNDVFSDSRSRANDSLLSLAPPRSKMPAMYSSNESFWSLLVSNLSNSLCAHDAAKLLSNQVETTQHTHHPHPCNLRIPGRPSV